MNIDRDLGSFKELLLGSCGLCFANERELTLSSAVTQRMSQRGIDSADLYHSVLITDQEELRRFIELLTVNETYFSREHDHLKLLVDKIVPEILSEREMSPVRIVSVGCSSGEEPYSIAIMLHERFGEESRSLFQITGADIDSSVIARAKQGIYGKGSFRGMDKAIQERYFEPCGPDTYQLGDIRHQVHFEVVNLKDACYPASMQQPDIIFYRNVSIYFPPLVQREIFGRLAGLLNQSGYLFVGAAETLQHDFGLLNLTQRDSLFFFRKQPGPATGERHNTRQESMVRLSKKPESLRSTQQGTPASIGQSRVRPSVGSVKPETSATGRDLRKLFDDALELAFSGRPKEALELIEAIIEQDGSFIKAHSLKGSILMSVSRFQEAAAVCNAILNRDPLCLEAYLMLGVSARHAGDDADAQRRFREAIYLKSSCWLAHFYMAEILFGQGDKVRARTGYEAALRVLENGSPPEQGRAFFPLSYNAEQYMAICRHKLSLLKNG